MARNMRLSMRALWLSLVSGLAIVLQTVFFCTRKHGKRGGLLQPPSARRNGSSEQAGSACDTGEDQALLGDAPTSEQVEPDTPSARRDEAGPVWDQHSDRGQVHDSATQAALQVTSSSGLADNATPAAKELALDKPAHVQDVDITPVLENSADTQVAIQAAGTPTTAVPEQAQGLVPLSPDSTSDSKLPVGEPVEQPSVHSGQDGGACAGTTAAASSTGVAAAAVDAVTDGMPAIAADRPSTAFLQHLIEEELGPPKFALAKDNAADGKAGATHNRNPPSLEALLEKEFGPPKFTVAKQTNKAAGTAQKQAPSTSPRPSLTSESAQRKPGKAPAPPPPTDAAPAPVCTQLNTVLSQVLEEQSSLEPAAAALQAVLGPVPVPPPVLVHMRLEVLTGPAAGVVYDTRDVSQEVRVGRLPDCTLSLANDPEVSSNHAVITYSALDRCWKLRDVGSLNGSSLNGQTLSSNRQASAPTALVSGDTVEFGSTTRVAVTCTPSTPRDPANGPPPAPARPGTAATMSAAQGHLHQQQLASSRAQAAAEGSPAARVMPGVGARPALPQQARTTGGHVAPGHMALLDASLSRSAAGGLSAHLMSIIGPPLAVRHHPQLGISLAVQQRLGADHKRTITGCEDVFHYELPWMTQPASSAPGTPPPPATAAVLALFDGHQGVRAAQKAKDIVPAVLREHLLASQPPGSLILGRAPGAQASLLRSTFLEADDRIAMDEGCTATLVLVERDDQGRCVLQSANVGDSSALLVQLPPVPADGGAPAPTNPSDAIVQNPCAPGPPAGPSKPPVPGKAGAKASGSGRQGSPSGGSPGSSGASPPGAAPPAQQPASTSAGVPGTSTPGSPRAGGRGGRGGGPLSPRASSLMPSRLSGGSQTGEPARPGSPGPPGGGASGNPTPLMSAAHRSFTKRSQAGPWDGADDALQQRPSGGPDGDTPVDTTAPAPPRSVAAGLPDGPASEVLQPLSTRSYQVASASVNGASHVGTLSGGAAAAAAAARPAVPPAVLPPGVEAGHLEGGGHWVKLSEDHRISTSDKERSRLASLGHPTVRTRLYGLNIARMLGDKFLKDQVKGFIADPHVSPPLIAAGPGRPHTTVHDPTGQLARTGGMLPGSPGSRAPRGAAGATSPAKRGARSQLASLFAPEAEAGQPATGGPGGEAGSPHSPAAASTTPPVAALPASPAAAVDGPVDAASGPVGRTLLVVASDGLWDVMGEAKVAAYLQRTVAQDPGVSVAELATLLLSQAVSLRSKDDITVMVMEVHAAASPAADPSHDSVVPAPAPTDGNAGAQLPVGLGPDASTAQGGGGSGEA